MDWGTALSDVNLVAVIVAVLASFAVGMVWYAESVFGKMWRKGAGLSKKDMDSKEGMGAIFGGTALFNIVSTLFLAVILTQLGTDSASEGALNGAVIGVTIVGLRNGIHLLFARKNLDHIMVEAGYDLVTMTIQGAILGAWI
jgi:hypothetical protein